MNSQAAAAQASTDSRHLVSRALGGAAAALLLLSLFFPYWKVRLFAPQYREGLTAVMYAYKVAGDTEEIDSLNHYVGVRKLSSLAVWERRIAVPGVVVMALLCLAAFSRGCRLSRMALGLPAAAFPLVFVSDMAFWMRYAATHLDPMAPLKLKAFRIPIVGVGKVAQFRSEVGPMPGFFLAAAASLLMIEAFWIAWSSSGCSKADSERKCAVRGICPLKEVVALLLVLTASQGWGAVDPGKLLADAPSGAVLELPPGTYGGPLFIDKPVTLRGGGRAVIDGRGHGTVVTVRAPGVTLEGLTLRGSGDSLLHEDSGVRVESGSATIRRCVLEDVLFGVFLVRSPGSVIEGSAMRGKPIDIGRRGDLIRSWNSDTLTVRDNVLDGGRDFVLWFSTGSKVEGNVISRGRYGLHFMYTNNASVSGNRFSDNSVGFYVMYSQKVAIRGNRFERHRGPSGAGLGLKESDWIAVADNDFLGNRQAVYIDGSPLLAENANVFTRNVFSRNDIGLSILPGTSGNILYDNVFDDNLQQVSRRGGGRLAGNEWRKDGRGNYWSDYAGYGASGGAVGRVPYRVESAWENLMDRQPLARFFQFTPAAEAVELASRAFPVFKPKPVLVDESPLLRAPFDPARSQAPTAAAWGLPAGLASFSCFLLGLPRFLRGRAKAPGAGRGAALAVKGLKKSFGARPVLEGVDLEAAPGETIVLWGSNGAGKSTLIKCVLGLHESDGVVTVFGEKGEAAREHIGYVSQELACYDWSVRRAMEFIADIRGADRAAIEPALTRCGLSAHAQARVSDLSGGMKQKLALSQALLADPPLLLLDEPCSNLDPKSRREFLDILESLKGSRAIVMTSHRVDEAERLADRVLWLEEGRPARLLDRAEFRREAAGPTPPRLEEACL